MKLNEHTKVFFFIKYFNFANWKVAHHLPSVNVIAGEMVQRIQALRDSRWAIAIAIIIAITIAIAIAIAIGNDKMLKQIQAMWDRRWEKEKRKAKLYTAIL